MIDQQRLDWHNGLTSYLAGPWDRESFIREYGEEEWRRFEEGWKREDDRVAEEMRRG